MDEYDESLDTSEEVSSEPETSAPEESSGEPETSAPEESSGEPETSAPEESSGEPETSAPEESSGEPEPSAPEESPGEPEPETPPSEETGSGPVQDLIDAIGDLNETITGAVTPEQPPVEGQGSGAGGGAGGGILVEETGGTVDLTPVVQVLERNEKLLIRTNELLEQQSEILTVQHNDLLQLQADVDFVFLAVAALVGVVLGVAVGKMFHDLWRS